MAPDMKSWAGDAMRRAFVAIAAVQSESQLLSAIDGASADTLGELAAQYPDSPALFMLSTVATLGPQFVGNSPGPQNFFVSALETWVARRLARITLGGGADAGLTAAERAAWIERFGAAWGTGAADVQAAIHAVEAAPTVPSTAASRLAARERFSRAAGGLTGHVQTGVAASGALLFLSGLGLVAAWMSVPPVDPQHPEPWYFRVPPDAVLSGLGGGMNTVSATIQLWRSAASAATVEGAAGTYLTAVADVSACAGALFGVIAAAYGLGAYIDQTPSLDYWKLTSLFLGLEGSLATFIAYLVAVPGGQFFGAALGLAAIIIGILEDPTAFQQWADGPFKTLVMNVLAQIVAMPEFGRALREHPELMSRWTDALVSAQSAPRFIALPAAEAARTRAVDRLVELGINAAQASQLVPELRPLPGPDHWGGPSRI